MILIQKGKRYALCFGIVLFLFAQTALRGQAEVDNSISFRAGESICSVSVRIVPSGSGLFLCDAEGEKMLSPPGRGENLFPVVLICRDHFFVLWTRYLGPETGLGIYDSRFDDGRIIPLPGLSFMPSPSLVLAGAEPMGVVFR